MPSATYTLFRNAILAEQQVVCTYEGRHRELCPHIIGANKNGQEVVLAWQFAGQSSGKLPQWRCLRLANVRDARARDGRWHEGHSHKTEQRCVSQIDLASTFTCAIGGEALDPAHAASVGLTHLKAQKRVRQNRDFIMHFKLI